MIEIVTGVYVDVNHIETVISEAGIFRAQTSSGQLYVISPRMFKELLKLKKQVDSQIGVRV